ncbi:cytochrome C [Acuticoccus sediminis]|uniref:Cytochrome C n=1 Tax=Acuticoccus sediminis TaxID=2184697 RepID=A0A8B2NJP5_9HYPH|nr:cytochrome c [Acuticoccus sediminis]RAH96217.1 cytochrome C [Acuticoccus sediminis]
MQRKRAVIMIGVGIAIGIAVMAGAVLWLDPGPAQSIELKSGDTAVIAEGEKVYAAQCAACHGANLEGQPNWRDRGPDGRLPAPPHDETGHTWHHADVLLFELTKYGPPKEMGNGEPYYSNMPAFENVLTDDEIIATLSYIKSRWPADIRRRHDQMNAQIAAQR